MHDSGFHETIYQCGVDTCLVNPSDIVIHCALPFLERHERDNNDQNASSTDAIESEMKCLAWPLASMLQLVGCVLLLRFGGP